MKGTCLYLVLWTYFTAFSQCGALYILTTPNLLRVDIFEKIVVESHDTSSVFKVQIRVQDFPAKSEILFATEVNLSLDNNPASVEIKIPADRVPKTRFKQYVIVNARFPNFELNREVLLLYETGHLFLQTDKPIYTPLQNVLYRLLTVDRDLKPNNKKATVEILTPQGVTVHQVQINKESRMKSSGISTGTFAIPELVQFGFWKIVAKYDTDEIYNYTTEFEVKEYVLPSFEVVLEPRKHFFYVDDVKLDVDIKARYTYGESIEGRAFALFGVVTDKDKVLIPSSLQSTDIIEGKASFFLESNTISEVLGPIEKLVGFSIYVIVSVITRTGSDMVEAENSATKIVKSPYVILFTKTPEYYKPGIPFDFMVSVTNPDGTPARRIELSGSHDTAHSESITGLNGKARMVINTPGSSTVIKITVTTKDPELPNERQATASMVAKAYKTMFNSNNYLHINPKVTDGDNLIVYLHVPKETAAVTEKIKHISYILMNKGAIVKVGKQPKDPGQTVVTMTVPITSALIPSFRLVAYYYIAVGGKFESVADSISIDVKDTCMGSLKITGANEGDNKKIYSPHQAFKLKVTGDSGAKFGLVAVDKAIYVLNNKNRLTQSKIWSTVEESDIECRAGSGPDAFGVFSDAGLAFTASNGFKSTTRTELGCKQIQKRKRRSLTLMKLRRSKESKYSKRLLRCCRDGMKSIPMAYSCTFRARRIKQSRECVDAFLDCCNAYQQRKKLEASSMMTLARSDDDQGYRLYEDIFARSNFRESWLWYLYDMPKDTDREGWVSISFKIPVYLSEVVTSASFCLISYASKEIPGHLPDSITSWEVQAVSISQDKGICVSDSYEMTVKKDFFIDLRLPYSIIRNEQVETKAILYNYHSEKIKVKVEFPYNEQICSGATPQKRFKQTVEIHPKSSEAVFYTIIPLVLGDIAIEIKASVYEAFVSDGVRKTLRVVAEGKQVERVQTIILDPQASIGVHKEFQVDNRIPDNVVPNTEPQTFISVQGNVLAETIENSIDGNKLKHLIRQPTGCGEQNMISMTPGVIVTHYLDKTAQWDKVGLDRRETALTYIRKGYAQQQAFRKPGGSYAAFINRASSTWYVSQGVVGLIVTLCLARLTAYVAKVFAMAQSLISIKAEVLCEDLKWLILRKQKPDGIFVEYAAVSQLEMQGGVHGAENDASLTAFVLIAMIEAKDLCSRSIGSYESSIQKAGNYLEGRIAKLTRAYSVAITTYALSLLGIHKDDILMKFASKNGTYWAKANKENSMYTIEATGYALLALLQLEKFEQTGKIVRWMSAKRDYGGGYKSTQATFVGLQALAAYLIQMPDSKAVNMDVTLTIKGRQNSFPWHFNTENVYVAKSEKININQNFTVAVTGQGQGMLTVTTIYNALLTEKAKECQKFDLRVTLEEVFPEKKPQGALSSVLINVCARNLEETEVTMTIADISMLTAFSPDLDDLKAISTGVDLYISKFELNKDTSRKSSLIIYLDKLRHDTYLYLFTEYSSYLKKNYLFGFMQPAAVEVYEYYDSANSCTSFYNLKASNAMLGKICHNEICRCAAENCVSLQKPNDRLITADMRQYQACLPEVDFVYKIRFLKKEEKEGYDYYSFKVLTVIKAGETIISSNCYLSNSRRNPSLCPAVNIPLTGSDEVVEGNDRFLVSHASCKETFVVDLQVKDYLIMGFQKDLWPMKNGMTYVVTKGTWVEWWPNNEECQARTYRSLCENLIDFSDTLRDFGCTT
ncbi:venom factor-like [Callorhinchus milii]|uniref:venom factor-like n=1 Tax=Callorhinchus milii TaxID=7868 RepID=UPI001C3F75A4|nr:venom factor-like [Callorhinchus milii]